jgi:hypothetical protein
MRMRRGPWQLRKMTLCTLLEGNEEVQKEEEEETAADVDDLEEVEVP